MAEIDPYAVLAVPRTATREEIARAYRRLAKQHHPDAGGPASPTMARINEAWSVLSSPTRRARWDRDHAVVHPPHWAATPPTAREPMRPPPRAMAGPPSVRDSGWLAAAVGGGMILVVVLVGVMVSAGGATLTAVGLRWLIAREGGSPADEPTALKPAQDRVRAEDEAARLPRAQVYGVQRRD